MVRWTVVFMATTAYETEAASAEEAVEGTLRELARCERGRRWPVEFFMLPCVSTGIDQSPFLVRNEDTGEEIIR